MATMGVRETCWKFLDEDDTKNFQRTLRANHKTPINAQDPKGRTCLFKAVAKGNIEALGILMEETVNSEVEDFNGHCPLHAAAYFGFNKNHQKCMKVLIKSGADVNRRDMSGRTPLHWAACWGNIKSIDILLDAGADPCLPDKDGVTPVDLARKKEIPAALLGEAEEGKHLADYPFTAEDVKLVKKNDKAAALKALMKVAKKQGHNASKPRLIPMGVTMKRLPEDEVELLKPLFNVEDEEEKSEEDSEEYELPGINEIEDLDGKHVGYWLPNLSNGKMFQVRTGPDYSSNKLKTNSDAFFYDVVATDVIEIPRKLHNIGRFIDLNKIAPSSKLKTDESPAGEGSQVDVDPFTPLPFEEKMFILNFLIPGYGPGNPLWGKAQKDGEGYALVIYYKMNDYGKKQMANLESNAAKLLHRFLTCGRGDTLVDQLKAIPQLLNAHEQEFNPVFRKIVTGYNAKPFMTGPTCHSFMRTNTYVEVDVDVHKYCYLARKACSGFLPDLGNMLVTLGVLLEGRGDEEQPEQMMGAVAISSAEVKNSKPLDYYQKQVRNS